MKKNILFAFVASMILWSSCSNDFDVTAPWKDIPVVYGLLNINDDVHYIRIEKAFLNPDGNALEIAKNPDSLYYDNLSVQLVRVSNGDVFQLQKVDGAGVGLPKQEGVFATEPNWLYKINASAINLVPGETIQLVIDRGNGLPLVTGETIVQDAGLQRSPNPGNPFSFKENLDTKLAWTSDENAKIFDAKLTIHYAEYPKSSPDQLELKSFVWQWARGKSFEFYTPQYIVMKDGIEFYQIMESNIPDKPDYNRIFQHIDLEIASGGAELEKFINVSLANSGITGSQEIPTYTNMSEGEGVFSTINYIRASEVLINPATRDSLRNGRITKHLNFQ